MRTLVNMVSCIVKVNEDTAGQVGNVMDEGVQLLGVDSSLDGDVAKRLVANGNVYQIQEE